MTLLNKLLNDLDERQADLAGDRDEILEGLSPARDADFHDGGGRPGLFVGGGIGIVLVGVAVWGYFSFFSGPAGEDLAMIKEMSAAAMTAAAADPAKPALESSARSASESVGAAGEPGQDKSEPKVPSQQKVAPAEPAARKTSADRDTSRPQQAKESKSESVQLERVAADPPALSVPASITGPSEGLASADSTAADSPPESDQTNKTSPTDEQSEASSEGGSFNRVLVTADDLYRKGLQLYESGRHRDGLAEIRQALERDPRHTEARSTLADLLIEKGRPDEALQTLSEGLTVNPQQYEWAQLAARLLVARDQVGNAVKLMQRNLPDAASHPEYYGLLAASLQRLERHEEAAEYFRKSVQVVPHKGIWWMGLGISLERMGEFADAGVAYNRALNDSSLSDELRSYINQRLTIVSRR